MGVQISEHVLKEANMTAKEFLAEVAVHLYDIGKLTMGQARKFAGLDPITFQKELAKRNVYIKYDINDFEEDMKTIEELTALAENKR